MSEFKKFVSKIMPKHEITNPRVLKNLEVLSCLDGGFVCKLNDHKTIGAVKFLNRKGLLKYKKGKEDELIIYPTLLFYYLTLVMKYDIHTVYAESIKLYEAVGEKLNDVKYI